MKPGRIAASVLAGGLVLGVSACAGGGAETPAPAESGSGVVGEPTKLVFWHGMTGPDGPAVQQNIEAFNASQSEVVVEAVVMPWDVLYDKLLTSVTSADGPQIIAMSASSLPQYAGKGALGSTEDFYADTTYMDTSVIAPAAVDASAFDGVRYGVPLNIATMMMYWNKDMFRAAGLDPEKPPATWDDFASMAQKLTVDENNDGKPEQYAIALGDHETVPMFQPLMWNNGGGVVSDDGTKSILGSPESIEALEYWTSLVRDQKISPIGLSGADADKLFQTQKAAIEIVGPWMTTGFDEAGINYGLAPAMAGPAGQVTLADAVEMTLNAKNTDAQNVAAYKFFAYWNSVEGQTTWANGSGFPSLRSDIPEGDLTNKYSAIFGAKEILGNSKVYLAGVPNAGTITDSIFYPALQRVLNGDGSVKDVFTEASAAVQAEIDKG